MRMFRTLTCLSVLLCAVGCGDSPTVENLSDAGAGMQGGKSPIKQSPAERLAGTYVSDRAASIAFLESTGHYDADKLASFGSVFGKMEITYRGDTRTTVIDGQVAQHKFTIVDSGPNHVTIECKWSQVEGAIVGEDSEINRIEFTDDGFWLGNQEIPMNQVKEKFVRKESAKTRDKETVPQRLPRPTTRRRWWNGQHRPSQSRVRRTKRTTSPFCPLRIRCRSITQGSRAKRVFRQCARQVRLAGQTQIQNRRKNTCIGLFPRWAYAHLKRRR